MQVKHLLFIKFLLASLLGVFAVASFDIWPITLFIYEQEFKVVINNDDGNICFEGGEQLRFFDKRISIADLQKLEYELDFGLIKIPLQKQICVNIQESPPPQESISFIRVELTDFDRDIYPNNKVCLPLSGLKNPASDKEFERYIERSFCENRPEKIALSKTGKSSVKVTYQYQIWGILLLLVFSVGFFLGCKLWDVAAKEFGRERAGKSESN